MDTVDNGAIHSENVVVHVCCNSVLLDESLSIEELLNILNTGEVELTNTIIFETTVDEYREMEQVLKDLKDILSHMLQSGRCYSSHTFTVDPYEPYCEKIELAWLHTDCTNILGHSWPAWGPWNSSERRHGARFVFWNEWDCYYFLFRNRACQRTHCQRGQIETMKVCKT